MSRSNAAAALLFRRKGDGSTLNLDFVAMGALDTRFTFTRSTTATYINSSGYVATMAATSGSDPTKARFDYNPTTLAANGLLIESAATNLLNFSETFATTGGTNNNWGDTKLTRTSTDNISPRNDATALRITATGTDATIVSSTAMGTSAERTFSIWIRRVTGTGTISYTLDNVTVTAFSITSSWVRYVFPTTTAAHRVGFRINAIGDAIEIWGAQLEAGKGASSYIPTVASQVIRAADICTFALTPANIGLTTSPIGTCFYQATANYLPASGYPTIVGFFDSGNNPKAWLSQMSADGNNYSSWKTTTGTVADVTFSAAIVPKTSFKFASSISSTQNLASRNGTAGTAGAVSSAVLSVPTQINFGYTIENITIANFKFFPTTKSQAELNALTT